MPYDQYNEAMDAIDQLGGSGSGMGVRARARARVRPTNLGGPPTSRTPDCVGRVVASGRRQRLDPRDVRQLCQPSSELAHSPRQVALVTVVKGASAMAVGSPVQVLGP